MTREKDFAGIRLALRDATMEGHRRVDSLFGRFALDSRAGYGAFLSAHARALGAIEPAAQPDSRRLPLLARDLAAMGLNMPGVLPPPEVRDGGFRWGLLYALEGSRLGGAMLARQVPDDLPRAYLSAVHGPGGWIAFQRALDAAAREGGEGWLEDAVQGALAAFALFERAASEQQAPAHG